MNFEDLLPLLQTAGAGVTVILGYLFYQERAEHRETRKAFDDLQAAIRANDVAITREVVLAVNNATAALDKIVEGSGETRISMAKIAEAVGILIRERPHRG